MSCLFSNDFKRDMGVLKKYICECHCFYDMFGFGNDDTTYMHFPHDVVHTYTYRPQYGTRQNTHASSRIPEVIYHQPAPMSIPEVIIEEHESSDDEPSIPLPWLLPPHVDTKHLSGCMDNDSFESSSDNQSPESNDSLDIVEAQKDLCVVPSSKAPTTERDVWHIL